MTPFMKSRAVKFFSEQRQFRFRVFHARDSVPCLSASPRLCEKQNILSQRQGRRVLLFLSCRNYPLETVSDRLRQPGTRDESCKDIELNSPPLRKRENFTLNSTPCQAVSLAHLFLAPTTDSYFR
ncbi:MAG: hypothetical protein DRI57_13200 [Deltaproteobacteria bacterium]|nr:MAG: hypothetical protein DRI57_13200 [Deltaproteobacteria bacterium]